MKIVSEISDDQFEKAVARSYRNNISIEDAMKFVGSLIDLSCDRDRDDGLESALRWSDELQRKPLSAVQRARLWYFTGNVWSHREKRLYDGQYIWDWKRPELENEVLHFRKAVNHAGFGAMDNVEKCECLTNLANALNRVGRFNEANDCWNLALSIRPDFGMAQGNLGLGQYHHARLLQHPTEKLVYVAAATLALIGEIDG